MRRCAAVSLIVLAAACSPSDQGGERGANVTGPHEVAVLDAFSLKASNQGRISFSGVETSGRSSVFSDVVMRITDEDGDESELRAQTLTLSGVRAQDGAATFDLAILKGVTADLDEDEDGEGDAGTLSIDEIELRGPNEQTAALIAKMLTNEGLPADYQGGDLEDYALDALVVSGVRIEGDDEGGAGVLTIQKLLVDGLADAHVGVLRVDQIAMNGADEEGTTFDMALNAFSVTNLRLGAQAGEQILAELDVRDANVSVNQAALPAQLSGMGGVDDPFAKPFDLMTIDDAYVDLDGLRIALNGLNAVNRLTGSKLVQETSLGAVTVKADTAKAGGARANLALSMLGYTEGLEFTGSGRQVADRDADRIEITKNELTLKDGFVLSSTGSVSGVAEYARRAALLLEGGDSEPGEDALAALYEPLKIEGFEMRLTDDSIVDRGLGAAAGAMGMSKDEVRQQAGMLIALGSMMATNETARALVSEAGSALQSFIAEPGAFVVKLEAEQPLAVADLMKAMEAGEATALPVSFANER